MAEGQRVDQAANADPAPPPVAVRQSLFARLANFRGVIASVATLGAILSGLYGYWDVYIKVRRNASTAEIAVAQVNQKLVEAVKDAGPLSIVVLPFGSADTDAAKLIADGLTASITSDLSRIRDAFIVSPQSAMAYRDKPLTARQIGSELGVRFVLRGTAQSAGTKIRVTAQLTDAKTDGQVWSEVFDGERDDLFALQDKITLLIGNSMGHELIIRAARDSEMRKSDSTIIDLVLRARALRLKPQTVDNWRMIDELWRRVIEAEPDHVEALVGLALAQLVEINNFFWYWDKPARAAKLAEAAALVAHARNLDLDYPELPFAECLLSDLQGDVDNALRAAERALELNPKLPLSYINLGFQYERRLNTQAAIDNYMKALALNPKHPLPGIFLNLAITQFRAGDMNSALGWATKARALNPNSNRTLRLLAAIYARLGHKDEARLIVKSLLALDPKFSIAREIEAETELDRYPAYQAWFMDQMVPALQLAGFPE